MPLRYINVNESRVKPIDLNMVDAILSRRQQRYDTAVAAQEAALQEALSRGYINESAREEYLNRARQSFNDVGSKYRGDLSRGYEDVQKAITSVRTDPYLQANQAQLEAAKLEQQRLAQLGQFAYINEGESVFDQSLVDEQGKYRTNFQPKVYDIREFDLIGQQAGSAVAQSKMSGIISDPNLPGIKLQQYGYANTQQASSFIESKEGQDYITSLMEQQGLDPNNQMFRRRVEQGFINSSVGKQQAYDDKSYTKPIEWMREKREADDLKLRQDEMALKYGMDFLELQLKRELANAKNETEKEKIRARYAGKGYKPSSGQTSNNIPGSDKEIFPMTFSNNQKQDFVKKTSDLYKDLQKPITKGVGMDNRPFGTEISAISRFKDIVKDSKYKISPSLQTKLDAYDRMLREQSSTTNNTVKQGYNDILSGKQKPYSKGETPEKTGLRVTYDELYKDIKSEMIKMNETAKVLNYYAQEEKEVPIVKVSDDVKKALDINVENSVYINPVDRSIKIVNSKEKSEEVLDYTKVSPKIKGNKGLATSIDESFYFLNSAYNPEESDLQGIGSVIDVEGMPSNSKIVSFNGEYYNLDYDNPVETTKGKVPSMELLKVYYDRPSRKYKVIETIPTNVDELLDKVSYTLTLNTNPDFKLKSQTINTD